MRATLALLLLLLLQQLTVESSGAVSLRQLEEEPPAPPPPPPPPLPPYPTSSYIFKVERLNGGAPLISFADNSSTYPVNTHPTWATATAAGPSLAPPGQPLLRWRRRAEEEPSPPPEGDGLLLQVVDMHGTASLALVERANVTAASAAAAAAVAAAGGPGPFGAEAFGAVKPENVRAADAPPAILWILRCPRISAHSRVCPRHL